MSKRSLKPGALVSPVPPVLVSCGTAERPNILTIAWTGIVNTIPPMTYISVRPQRYSYPLIRESGAFVINLATRSLVRAADWCGVRSGAKEDKFAACGLTPELLPDFPVPAIAESPVQFCCRVREVIPLGSHDMFLADIVGMYVDEQYVDPAGKLRLDRAGLLTYSHGEYFALGEKLGTFGFSVRKPVKKRRGAKPSPKRKK